MDICFLTKESPLPNYIQGEQVSNNNFLYTENSSRQTPSISPLLNVPGEFSAKKAWKQCSLCLTLFKIKLDDLEGNRAQGRG
jgi:hypothetical protein